MIDIFRKNVHPVARSINRAYFAMLVCLLLCIMIRPQGLASNDGISYFGVYHDTFAPYIIGFCAVIYYYWRAAQSLPSGGELAQLRLGFVIWITALFGVMIFPHNIQPFGIIHAVFGSTLFFTQALVASWLTWKTKLLSSWLLFSLLIISGLFSLYYLPASQGYMLISQISYQIIFWLLFDLGIARLTVSK